MRQHTGVSAREAAEQVRAASALAEVPAAAAALAAGEITSGHVKVLARLEPAQAAALVEAAKAQPVDLFERTARAVEQAQSADGGASAFEASYRRRSVSTFVDEVGMTAVMARLDAVAGAIVTGALERIASDLYDADPTLSRSARLADAMVEMAKRATAVVPGEAKMPAPSIVVLMEHTALLDRLDAAGAPCHLADGMAVPAATARRLACEAGIVPAVLDGRSQVLDFGRSRRLPSPAQRHTLVVRDGGCVYPGCDRGWRWCEAHHLRPWDAGGPTDLDNLALVCTRHHHDVHERGHRLQRGSDGRWRARLPDGRALEGGLTSMVRAG